MALTKQTIDEITSAQNFANERNNPLKTQLNEVFDALRTSRLNDDEVMKIVGHCKVLAEHGIPSEKGALALKELMAIQQRLPASEPEVGSILENLLYACCYILVVGALMADLFIFFCGFEPGCTPAFFLWIDTPSSSYGTGPVPAINTAMSKLTSTASGLNTERAVSNPADKGGKPSSDEMLNEPNRDLDYS